MVEVGEIEYITDSFEDKPCQTFKTQDVCSLHGPTCRWDGQQHKCLRNTKLSAILTPEFIKKSTWTVPTYSDDQVNAALKEAQSLAHFHAIIGEQPMPEDFFRAYLYQSMYEKDGNLNDEQYSTWEGLDYLKTKLMEELDAVTDPTQWIKENEYKLHYKTPNPAWNGLDENIPKYLTGDRQIYPGTFLLFYSYPSVCV